MLEVGWLSIYTTSTALAAGTKQLTDEDINVEQAAQVVGWWLAVAHWRGTAMSQVADL